MMTRIAAGWTVFTAISVAAGCGPAFVAVEPSRVQSLAVLPPDATGTFCANDATLPLRALVTYRDGTRLSNAALRRDKVDALLQPGELTWSSNLGVIHGQDLVLPADRRSFVDQPVILRATSTRDPRLTRSLTLTPRYDCGLVDGDGRHGADLAGEDGARGHDIDVALTYHERPEGRLVLAQVHSGTRGAPSIYLIDPEAPPGSFAIRARGGRGGDGSAGRTGTTGSTGSDGFAGNNGSDGPDCTGGFDGGAGGDGGPGGNGGDGQDGGPGGDGGTITIVYDDRYPELVRLLRHDVSGGAPGRGGRGGDGGPGGSGGRGGSGGHGGSSTDPARPCHGRSGNHGRDGSTGPSGSRGPDGHDGRRGHDGEVRTRPASADSMLSPATPSIAGY